MFDFDDLREDEENLDEDYEEKPADLEEIITEKRVFPVRLGKFKSVSNGIGGGDDRNYSSQIVNKGDDGVVRRGEGETSSSNLDARRCFSMGSYQYVVQDANLQVALSGGVRNGEAKSLRTRVGLIGNSAGEDGSSEGKRLHAGSKGESFSVSKIWLWPNKKGKLPFSDASNPEGGLPWMVRRGSDDNT